MLLMIIAFYAAGKINKNSIHFVIHKNIFGYIINKIKFIFRCNQKQFIFTNSNANHPMNLMSVIAWLEQPSRYRLGGCNALANPSREPLVIPRPSSRFSSGTAPLTPPEIHRGAGGGHSRCQGVPSCTD